MDSKSLWSLIHDLHVKWLTTYFDIDNNTFYYWRWNPDDEAIVMIKELIKRAWKSPDEIVIMKAEGEINNKLN